MATSVREIIDQEGFSDPSDGYGNLEVVLSAQDPKKQPPEYLSPFKALDVARFAVECDVNEDALEVILNSALEIVSRYIDVFFTEDEADEFIQRRDIAWLEKRLNDYQNSLPQRIVAEYKVMKRDKDAMTPTLAHGVKAPKMAYENVLKMLRRYCTRDTGESIYLPAFDQMENLITALRSNRFTPAEIGVIIKYDQFQIECDTARFTEITMAKAQLRQLIATVSDLV